MSKQTDAYDAWLFAEGKLKYYKSLEATLRKQICIGILGETIDGTVTNEETPGYIVKATAKITRKILDPERLAQCGHLMSAEEKSVYSWSYVAKINLDKYKLHKGLFHVREQVVEKPGASTLTIEKGDKSIAEHDASINPNVKAEMQSYQEATQGMHQQQLNQGEFLHVEVNTTPVEEVEEDFDW